jgi:hypothetical protein
LGLGLLNHGKASRPRDMSAYSGARGLTIAAMSMLGDTKAAQGTGMEVARRRS